LKEYGAVWGSGNKNLRLPGLLEHLDKGLAQHPVVPIARLEADHEDHTCIHVAVSTGYQKGRKNVGSSSGEFKLAGSLS
jgi:hypothetical protein